MGISEPKPANPVKCYVSIPKLPCPELSAWRDIRWAVMKSIAVFGADKAAMLLRYAADCLERDEEPRP